MRGLGVASWLKDRLGLGSFFDHLIPAHANGPTYVIGGSVVVLGILQGVTGVLLQQFYHPMPNQNAAYASVQYIASVPLWNFVRNLHYWGAQLIFVLVILHMMRVYVSGAYKKPRELLWVSGVALLALAWLLLFTGTVLRWDQEAVEALGHNLELASFAGPLAYWFSPSFAPDVPILIRLNSAHVTILPVIALAFVGLHVYLIRIQGISSPARKDAAQERQVPFSSHVTKMIHYGLLAAALVAILSLAVQAPLSSVGNPAIEVSKPDWYMLWVYSIEGYLSLAAVPYVLTPSLILMLIVPALDRGPETDPSKRKLMMVLLAIAMVVFAALTVGAALSPPKSHLG
ncbi:MAG: cytochrome b N-terminal domain-containing protein [Nitrososphaerales archaeon]|nr:cytochrome b N-terminal domain-containing protein [Nitrososphaerales archaeon]